MSAPAIDVDSLSRLIPSRTARGLLLAVVSGLFFNFLNAAVKELAGEMPPLYVAWGRWLAGIALIAPYLLWRVGWAGMRTRDMKLHCLRGLFHTPGYGLWYEAVVWLPLATMAALGFTGPIFVTLGAVIFRRETSPPWSCCGRAWSAPSASRRSASGSGRRRPLPSSPCSWPWDSSAPWDTSSSPGPIACWTFPPCNPSPSWASSGPP